MPTDDYIKRSELIEHFQNYNPNWGVIDKDTVLDDIRNFPAADVEPKQRWIPVTERLPKRFVEVLVVSDGCVIYGYLGYMGLWFTGINSTLGSVTHWMPLPPDPEPPKEDDDED